MRAPLLVVSAALLAACRPGVTGAADLAAPITAFRHVNVVDVASGVVQRDRTLIVAGAKIRDVSPSDGPLPPRATVVDATGLYAIPGLWDMHAHVLDDYERHAPLLLAHGITGVRHPGGSTLDTLRAVRARRAMAGVPLPRLVSAGVIVDGVPPVSAGSAVVRDAAHADVVVDSLRAGGADFVKVYGRLSRDGFLAVARAARRRGLAVTGHLPNGISLAEASDSGLRNLDHVFQLPVACSAHEAALRQRLSAVGGNRPAPGDRPAIGAEALATYDRGACQRLAARLAHNGTALTPTLHLARVFSRWGDPTLLDPAVLPFFPDARRELAGARVNPEFLADSVGATKLYAMLARTVGDMHRAGVLLLAGTDTPAPYQFAGFSLHDELRTLVRDAGLTPLEALRTATLNPARFLGATDSLGTIAPGMLADLVLLRDDPLASIEHTRRIAGVVVNGRWLDRAALDALLATARPAAAR